MPYCLRRMEQTSPSACLFCFGSHEQLQSAYKHHQACTRIHLVTPKRHLQLVAELGCVVCRMHLSVF